jgi:AsmA protein
MRYLVIAVLGMMLLVTAAVFTLPHLAGGEFVTQQLQQAVARSTGRTLTLLKAPTVQVFPDAKVSVEGVSLSNPDGLFNGTTVSMERLDAKISLWQLLSRRADVQELTLVRPRLTLVIDKQGQVNWQLPQGPARADGSATGPAGSPAAEAVSIAPVRIIDGEVTFNDERSGTSFAVQAVNATVSLPLAGKPLNAGGSARWNGQKVNLKLFLKDIARLTQSGSPIELALDAQPLQVAVSGLLKLDGGIDLAGQANITSPDLRQLAGWGGWQTTPGGGLKDFSAQGALSLGAGRAVLSNASISLDGMKANGLVRVLTRSDRPKVEASLGIARLDLNAYTGHTPAGAGTGRKTAQGWSQREISLAGLDMADATLRLKASQIVYGELTMKDVSLDAELVNGKLSSTLNSLTLYGASANGVMQIDGSQNTPRLAGKLIATGADTKALLSDLAGISQIGGKADIRLDLAASGRSQAEMVSNLLGTARMEVRDGLLEGVDIAGMVQGVQRSILDGWSDGASGSTRFDTLSADFTVKDGIAETRQLLASGQGFRIEGNGEADILRRRLNFKVAPQVAAADGSGMSTLPVPVVVAGPWAAPRIYPDIEGVLKDPQSAFDTLGKLGVNIEGASRSLRGEAEKLLGKDGARQAEEIGGKVLKDLLKLGD